MRLNYDGCGWGGEKRLGGIGFDIILKWLYQMIALMGWLLMLFFHDNKISLLKLSPKTRSRLEYCFSYPALTKLFNILST